MQSLHTGVVRIHGVKSKQQQQTKQKTANIRHEVAVAASNSLKSLPQSYISGAVCMNSSCSLSPNSPQSQRAEQGVSLALP